ncbi:GDSL esterase/lipase At4g10955-like [Brassica napus]|uniref:GDSL esterase/lipase At4g10955-like n=1 Tax=Brassica napus TaxID=3708 RepID=UPI002078680F|nr:GDSL esterase/lipase At4g10955-like [Brassica napus]
MGGASGSKNSGPKHMLPEIDWLNSYHRTIVTSSLIQGVYLLQREKQKKVNSQSYLWWESFGFSLVKQLINEDDDSIYGAVFEYNTNNPHSGMPPRSVVAFRGTLLKSKTWLSDVEGGIQCFFNNLNKGSRFQQAIQAVQTVLEKNTTETTSVWLAGHSLGAGIALMVGKTLAKNGVPLKTFAFNPPILSIPLEKLPVIDMVKGMFRFTESVIKGTFALLAQKQTQDDDPRVAAWTPYLYVNPSDGFCSECINILKYKIFMALIGLGKFESIGAAVSFRCLTFGIESGEPIQLLSSAVMLVNKKKSDDETTNVLMKPWYKFKKAHGLEQWWEPNPAWDCHRFRSSEPRMD